MATWRGVGLAGALTAAVLSGAPAAVAGAPELPVLARANARWRGASCTLRLTVELKSGKNGEGWSRTRLYAVGVMHTQTDTGIVVEKAMPKGEQAFYFTFEVSDRDALAPIYGKGVVPSGTRFVSEGWFLARPEDEKGPYLQLRFADLPQVKARFWFAQRGGFGTGDSYPLKHFGPVERYLRVEAFSLQAADEQLAQAPAAGTGAPPAPGAGATFRPALRIVAAACQPARVPAGEEVDLVLTYAVEGLPPGASFEVVERRAILSGETAIATFEKPMGRVADTYTSTQRVRIPAGASPGLYSMRGTVTMAGVSAEGTALLEVRGPLSR